MQAVLDILGKAGGWHPGLSLRIENQPYMALVIEAMDEPGPCGLPALSVAHYGEGSGNLLRDPEMGFELGFAGGAHLSPFYWRNDHVGVEQWSRFTTGTDYAFERALFRQHVAFARVWDRNLRSQDFAGAFERQRQTQQA